MVDDFPLRGHQLAERIAHLREVKDEPEDERALAAKRVHQYLRPLANRFRH